MGKPVATISAIDGFPVGPADSRRFGAFARMIGQHLGLEGLGCMHLSVEPGMRAFPFHNHLGNDELFVILEGTGLYRHGDAEHPIGKGDVCAASRGGPETAHQIVNSGSVTLEYLAISTMNDPEIVEYPDSGKFAALAIWPGEDFRNAHLRFIGRAENGMGYYDGEDV